MLDKLIPKCYTIIVKREVPTRDTMKGDEVHRVKKVRKKKNSLLTNSTKCGTINSRGEGKAVPQRERPTRVSKTFNPMTRPHGVPVCGIQM